MSIKYIKPATKTQQTAFSGDVERQLRKLAESLEESNKEGVDVLGLTLIVVNARVLGAVAKSCKSMVGNDRLTRPRQ